MKLKENRMKNIVIIGTGGTIAGTGEQGKTALYKAGQINVGTLTASVSDINNIANITTKDILNVDSCDITCQDWILLAKTINELSQNNNIDGFVITHGTDTLEETAYFLNLTLKTDKPVVLTGSMRPATAMSPDGPFNLYQAVALARSDEAVGKGVLVVFSDGIYGARDIQKINSYKTDAFSHRDLGSLGFMRDDKAYFYNISNKLHTKNTEFNLENIKSLPHVSIVSFYAGADIRILDYVSKISDGIVIAGAGCGGCSIKWNEKIKEIALNGVPIVRSSRISNGLVTSDDIESSEREVFADTLSPQKARILLMLALNETKDIKEIQKIFNKY